MDAYLVATERRIQRLTQTAPDLKAGEVAIKIVLELPRELFRKPQLSASIKIGEAPALDISAETIGRAEQVLKDAGIPLRIIVEDPPMEGA